MKKQRCNNCMTVQDESFLECEKCGRDDCLMYPFEDKRTNTMKNRMSIRGDVKILTYHRPPTKSEIRFGHGAIHYRDFTPEECCFPGTRIPKKWFVASDDGLRYYR
jgi:hypothetical protein